MRHASSLAPSHRRLRARRHRSLCVAIALLPALELDSRRSAVQCLLLPPPAPVRSGVVDGRAHLRLPSLAPSSLRRLPHREAASPLCSCFDRFLHPYGVSDDDRYEDELGDQLELLSALLPNVQTEEDRAKILEGFQRARLDEQLRLSKLSRRGRGCGGESDDGSAPLVADDKDEASRMTDIFQRARLAEQLRLSRRAGSEGNAGEPARGEQASETSDGFDKTDEMDKDEAFHRALLGEMLKIRQLQRQRQQLASTFESIEKDEDEAIHRALQEEMLKIRRQRFVSISNSIEEAMMEFEIEREQEQKSLQTMAMVEENEGGSDDCETNDSGKASEAANSAIVTGAQYTSDGNGKVISTAGGKLLANQTEDTPSRQMTDELERLRRMVAIAAASPPARATSSATKNTTSSLKVFWATTNLPLPPREDATFLSLSLAPVAHALTAAFLLGAAAFYAALAPLDVICNDDDGECGARACLGEASSVLRICLGRAFPAAGEESRQGASGRVLQAFRTSCIASFYAVSCVLVRAAKHSKCAGECLDSLAGALRYLIYSVRSANVLRIRALDFLVGFCRERRRTAKTCNNLHTAWKSKLNPVQMFSDIKSAAAARRSRRLSPRYERQRSQSQEAGGDEPRPLDADRAALERERRALEEERRRLDFERRKLLGEGVIVLDWYWAASEAASAAGAAATGTAAAEDGAGKREDRARREKQRWILWRRQQD